MKNSTDKLNFVLTAQEAAAMWQLAPATVSAACRRGAIPGRKSGRVWLLTLDDMIRYRKGRTPEFVPPVLDGAYRDAKARYEAKKV